MNMNIGSQREDDMYYYNRPIGWYIFAGTFALAMIVNLASEGKFTWMGLAFSILWGIVIFAFGNILWALIGDIVTPYIHRDRLVYSDEAYEEEVTPVLPVSTPLQNSGEGFERALNKVVSDHKLWAGRGMSALTEEEENELRQYIKERWFSPLDEMNLPDYLSLSLRKKMIERRLVAGNSLTPYGEKTIPCNNNLTE